jgi:hypothetical protein
VFRRGTLSASSALKIEACVHWDLETSVALIENKGTSTQIFMQKLQVDLLLCKVV